MHPIVFFRGIVAGATFMGLAACAESFSPGVALTGRWGGKDLVANLTPTGGTLDLTCAYGQLDAPLVPDNDGRVSASGFTVVVGGAPPPVGYVPPRWPMVVNGRVDGSRLTLTMRMLGVFYTENGPPRYALVRGQEGQVFACP